METPSEVSNNPETEQNQNEEDNMTIEEKEKEAKNLMKEGKYSEAAELFGEVLEEKCNEFGELAKECGDAYFNYGRSLLATAKHDFDALGGIIKKNVEKKLLGALGKQNNAVANTSSEVTGKGKIIDTTQSDEEEEEEEEEEEGIDVEGATESLELAWQVLESARIIYSTDPEAKLKLAEVHLCTGDVSMESDNMDEAIREYTKSLELKQSVLPEDDRALAEIHYSIGLAQQYQDHFPEAHSHYVQAKKILEAHVNKLKESKELDTDSIKDIEEILIDLAMKIDEVKDTRGFSLQKELAVEASPFGTRTVAATEVKDLGVFGKGGQRKQPIRPTTVVDGKAEEGSESKIKRKIEEVSENDQSTDKKVKP